MKANAKVREILLAHGYDPDESNGVSMPRIRGGSVWFSPALMATMMQLAYDAARAEPKADAFTVILIVDDETSAYVAHVNAATRLEAVEAACALAYAAGRNVGTPDDWDYLDSIVYRGHLREYEGLSDLIGRGETR
jgi:hypothetical protein